MFNLSMTSALAIPSYIAALRLSCRNPVERECLLGWANASLVYFWAGLF
jgi:hypothetical protein